MSTFLELVEKAKQQTQALRTTLNELATVPIETPTHEVPEIARALAMLHAIRNGYLLTEVQSQKMQDYIEGKVEGIESAIEALEGRGANKRPRKPSKKVSTLSVPAPIAKAPSTFDVSTDIRLAKATPKPRAPEREQPAELKSDLGKGKLAVLVAVGECADRGATHAHIGLLTTYKARSRENYLGELRALALIEQRDGRHFTTGRGERALKAAGFVRTPVVLRLNKGEVEVAHAIAKGDKRGVTKGIIALETDYKARSIDNHVATLIVRDVVETREGRQYLTAFGRAELKEWIPPVLHGLDLRNRIREELSEGEACIFEVLEETGHDGLTKASLVAELDAKYKTRSVENYLGRLKTRELVTLTDGVYVLEDRLFAKG